MQLTRPTWAEVDLSAIRDNIGAIRARVGGRVRIMPAVKADGYGHGAVPISRACLEAGADVLCVACIDEAMELREAEISAPILIMGCSEPSVAELVVTHNVESTACDLPFARALSEAAVKHHTTAAVHIKVDTGMGRIGVAPQEALAFAAEIAGLPAVRVAGVFTHFPVSDEPDGSFTLGQVGEFSKLVGALRRQGFGNLTAHASNSGGILAYPEADFDGVRPGIMIYGHYPSEDVPRTIPVREALTLKTRIAYLKQAPAGSTVSYGRTHRLAGDALVATLPVGYADGFSRYFSNNGAAAVRGERAPVIGRVCMDQTMLDVTRIPGVGVGDEVVLYGGGYDYLSLSRLAAGIGTISYELLCNIGKRVPRIYLNA